MICIGIGANKVETDSKTGETDEIELVGIDDEEFIAWQLEEDAREKDDDRLTPVINDQDRAIIGKTCIHSTPIFFRCTPINQQHNKYFDENFVKKFKR